MRTQNSKARRGGAPCVWVSAGLLSWYLCDREFDCDHCPLHHALTRSARRPLQAAATWPEECRYTPGHLWVRRQADGLIQVGITPFGAELLNPVDRWQTATGKTVDPEAPLIIAHTQAGPVRLHLPFEARVESFNPWLATGPLWPLADPWDSGYFAHVQATSWKAVRSACPALEDLTAQLRRQQKRVGEALSQTRWSTQPATLAADGGVPVGGLASALGLTAYRALLDELFGV